MTSRTDIDEHLAVLVGLPLAEAGRAVDMATFGFRPVSQRIDRRGPVQVGDIVLHIQETWRIRNGPTVLLGYGDWHYPPDGAPVAYEEFVERDAESNRQDDLRGRWLDHGREAHLVVSAQGRDTGDLEITLADGCVIETFVNQASVGDDDELWRLFETGEGAGGQHFVVTAHGIES